MPLLSAFLLLTSLNYSVLPCRDFRLILSPKKGVLHSRFEAAMIDGDGRERPVSISEYNIVLGYLFQTRPSHNFFNFHFDL